MPNSSSPEIEALRALMDERDKRYEQRFKLAEEAVHLAKENVDATKGMVNIVGVISVIGLLLAVAEKFR